MHESYVHFVENKIPHDNLIQLSPGRRAIIILFVVQWSYPKKQLTFSDSTTGLSQRTNGSDDDTDDVSLPRTGCASD